MTSSMLDERRPSSAKRQRIREMSDAEVVACVLEGEEVAFEEIVERYQQHVIRVAQSIVRDQAEAEDIAQETFLRAYRSLYQFDGSGRFKQWLITITANCSRRTLERWERTHILQSKEFVEFEDPKTRPDRMFHQREADKLVRETTAKIPIPYRQTFELRELEGKSYEEIAEITNCNIGTVRSRLNRGRRAFADIIAPWID